MAVVGEIAIYVAARTAGFLKGMKKAQRQTKQFSTGVRKSMAVVKKAIGGLSVLTTGAGIAGLAVAFNNVRQSIDNLGKTADKLGIATEQLQGLRFAAEKAGVAANTFDMAMQRATRRIAEAAQGTGEAQAAIKELGLNAESLSRIPLDRQMRVIADSFQRVDTQADRVRLAFKLFDSEGVNLVNVLKDGSKGLDDMQKQFEKLGGAVSREDVERVERFNNAMTDLKTLLGGQLQKIVIELSPGAQETIEGLIVIFEQANRAKGVVGSIASGVASGAKGAANLLNRAIGNDVESQVQRQLRSGIATGSQEFDEAIVRRFNRAQRQGSAKRRQLEEAGRGARIAAEFEAQRRRQEGFDRFVSGSASALRGLSDRLAPALASEFKELGERLTATGERQQATKRFDELLALAGQRTPQLQQKAATRFIEATSVEGLSRIRQSRRPQERMLKISEEQLKELKSIGQKLDRSDEVQELLT